MAGGEWKVVREEGITHQKWVQGEGYVEVVEVRSFKSERSMGKFVGEIRPHHARQIVADRRRVRELSEALRLAGIRLQIAADRMRACHEDTGQHELLSEIDSFAQEAREALGAAAAPAGREGA
jgi:hypothetical protein